ncbi:MAG TPA: NAD(P)H-dependent oxidoreductase subunit E [Chloroflexota bacterium]|nr:NAD(P)H-dependent oxidoreductase subunit E [Chloroflexota bacterium]
MVDAGTSGRTAGGGPGANAPAAAGIDRRARLVEGALRRHQERPDALIEVLHAAQNAYGYLTPELLWHVARRLRLPPSKVYGVATFYNVFSLQPAGAHTLVICQGTACYIRGAPGLATALRGAYGVASGETTADGQLSALTARCLGACSLAPAAVLDGAVLSRLTPESLLERVAAAVAVAAGAAPAPEGAG